MWQNIILWICIAINWVCIVLNLLMIHRNIQATRVAREQADRLYAERMRIVFRRLTNDEE